MTHASHDSSWNLLLSLVSFFSTEFHLNSSSSDDDKEINPSSGLLETKSEEGLKQNQTDETAKKKNKRESKE